MFWDRLRIYFDHYDPIVSDLPSLTYAQTGGMYALRTLVSHVWYNVLYSDVRREMPVEPTLEPTFQALTDAARAFIHNGVLAAEGATAWLDLGRAVENLRNMVQGIDSVAGLRLGN